MKKIITAAVLAAILSVTALAGCTVVSGEAYSGDESTAVSAAEEISNKSCCHEENAGQQSEMPDCCKDKSKEGSQIPDCCDGE